MVTEETMIRQRENTLCVTKIADSLCSSCSLSSNASLSDNSRFDGSVERLYNCFRSENLDVMRTDVQRLIRVVLPIGYTKDLIPHEGIERFS